jgi:DNA-binding winged helix-turn-helix (wHTH) protein
MGGRNPSGHPLRRIRVIGAMVPSTKAAVLRKPCNFPDKGCNLADIACHREPARRSSDHDSGFKMFQFEGYTLDVGRNALRSADRDVQLRPKAFEVLRYLIENADRLVTKEELIQAVWPNVIVTDDVLTHCVSEVRQAIGDGGQIVIKTVPRRGYRFAAAVSRITTNSGGPPSAAKEAEAAPSGSDAGSTPELSLPDKPSIAVLPFSNMSGNPEDDYCQTGTTNRGGADGTGDPGYRATTDLDQAARSRWICCG